MVHLCLYLPILDVKSHFWVPLKADLIRFWRGAGDSLLQSGLTKAVKESTVTLQQAEYEFLSFVRQQTPPGLCPLAGKPPPCVCLWRVGRGTGSRDCSLRRIR